MFAEAQTMTDPTARIAKFTEMQAEHHGAGALRALLPADPTTMCCRTTGGFYLHPVYLINPTQYWKK